MSKWTKDMLLPVLEGKTATPFYLSSRILRTYASFTYFRLTNPCVYTGKEKYRKITCCSHIFKITLASSTALTALAASENLVRDSSHSDFSALSGHLTLFSSPEIAQRDSLTICLTCTIVLLERYSWALKMITKSRYHMPNIA